MDKKNNRGNILLESGTNEIEIMEFKINNNLYGINVAKVREIMMAEKVTSMPHTHVAVEGIYKPRDILITVVNLPYYLHGDKAEKSEKDIFIVTNFNKMHISFRVNSVEGIVRLSWQDVQKPDKSISSGEESIATGIAQVGDKIITILDFERIITEIAPQTGMKFLDPRKLAQRQISNVPLVVAEDSLLLSKMILECLSKSAFTNVTKFDNGQEAWEYILKFEKEENILEKVGLLITDIEMPLMDGHRLIKLIKSNERLKKIPIIIFSSMINDELYIKGKQLGAEEQISKPEIDLLVDIVDSLIEKNADVST